MNSELNVNPQLELLSQMIEEISGELALEPLLQRIAERACRLSGADDSMIGLYDPERDAIRTAATYGKPMNTVLAYVPRGQGLAGHVLQQDAPVRIRYGDLARPLPTESPNKLVMGVPVRMRGELIGVFCLGAWPPKRMGVNTQALLEQFARHAAVSIDNARRYSGEQQRADRFALIARVAAIISSTSVLDTLLQRAADALHEVLGYANVDIPLLDPDDPHTLLIRVHGGDYKRLIRHESRLPIGVGIMGAAAAERRSQLVNNARSDPRYVVPPGMRPALAELAVPILHGSELLGVLNVEADRVFGELDLASLEIVAEHLGVTIVNARLMERARVLALLEERQRLARDLHDNVTQVMSSISLVTQSLPEAWQRDPAEGARRAVRLSELAQLAFSELRALLQELSPSAPSRGNAPCKQRSGLQQSLNRLLSAMMPPQIGLHLDLARFPPQLVLHEDAMLRVCQEAVSNAVRHAAPTRIEVIIRVSDTTVRLSVSDDGLGMPDSPHRGMGLRNMHQRMIELGGSLRVSKRRGGGTRIEARLPRADQQPRT